MNNMRLIAVILLCLVALNCQSQNLIQLLNGEEINAQQIISMRGDLIVYKTGGTVFDINKSEVEYVLHAELGEIKINIDCENEDTVNVENYTGFLLDKGNNVYIPVNSPNEYERSGADVLKRLIKQNGFWNIVNQLRAAHFVLEYKVSLTGLDRSYLIIKNRSGCVLYNTLKPVCLRKSKEGSLPTNEDIDRNRHVSKQLYEKELRPIFDDKNNDSSILMQKMKIFEVKK